MTWAPDPERTERFRREVPMERARLALEDPAGELDAVAPISQIQARQMLLEGGEQPLYRGTVRPVALSGISTDPPPPMLIDRLDPLGHTILYGTGGVGKGALACWWVVLLIRAGYRVLILDYEKHPEEWSRRIASLDPSVHAGDAVWHMAPTDPIAKAAADIAWACDANALDYVVVDSAVMACGADPLKPEAAAAYAAAILEVGRPVLTLAHVTKVDDARYPFGSVFWHNLARMTWSMQADQSGAIVLTHRKHNNYASLGRFAVVTTWTDGRLGEVYERDHTIALKDRIAEALAGGPLSLGDIVEALNGDDMDGVPVKRTSVRRTLNRYLVETFRLSGSLYELAS